MDKDDYEVGYGRPPREHQIQKGEVRNPRGRPKGSENMKTILREELEQKVTINTATGQKKISARRALIKRLIDKGLKGDFKANSKLLEMDIKFNPVNTVPEPDPDAPLTGVLLLPGPRCKTYEEAYAKHGHKTYQTVQDWEQEQKDLKKAEKRKDQEK